MTGFFLEGSRNKSSNILPSSSVRVVGRPNARWLCSELDLCGASFSPIYIQDRKSEKDRRAIFVSLQKRI